MTSILRSTLLPKPLGKQLLAVAALSAAIGAAYAKPQELGNMGLGLRELASFHASRSGMAPEQFRSELGRSFGRSGFVVLDGEGRVRVNVHLDGKLPPADVHRATERLGGRVIAESAVYRHGVLTAFVPIAKAAELARTTGVKSVLLAPPPVTDVGATTSQGVATTHADQVLARGITGKGVTVGLMSDSFDTSGNPINAASDVSTGDLPGPGNPNGHTQPVVVVQDEPGGTDEGRAMTQIVHDLAPDAKLCFATAYDSETAFAANIRALADKSGPCAADVIADDVIYFAEPMFSDGIVAQAVDDVVAQGVSYFSSAGNRPANSAYLATFNPLADGAARSGSQTVNLALIAPGETPGGFHNLAGSVAPDISRTISVASATNTFVMEWNDPFDSGGVTTDYDLYLYSADGTQLVAASTDDNFATDEPVEAVQVGPGTYQVVVARADTGAPVPVADQIRFITFATVTGGEYLTYKTPGTYGHNSARGALGTAAVPWYESYLPESFTSLGPVTIYFDGDGHRLAAPETREKPDIAAPDGVNTTFFYPGGDTTEDADAFPNFFGTSAAAPHGAGVAALVIQAAGGPGSITPSQMKQVLQQSAAAHDLTANRSVARAKAGQATVTVSAIGDGNNLSGTDPNGFTVRLLAPDGFTLGGIQVDVTNANAQRVLLGVPAPGLQFDPRVVGGFPPTLGELEDIAAADISFSTLSQVPPFDSRLTLTFAPGSFTNKTLVSFGVDRDERALGAGGNSMDLLIGGRIRGYVVGPTGNRIPFVAPFKDGKNGKGYSIQTGYGLIDAASAVRALP